jgi:hypothetical protein
MDVGHAKTSGSLDVIGSSPLTCYDYRDSSNFTLLVTNYSNFFMELSTKEIIELYIDIISINNCKM